MEGRAWWVKATLSAGGAALLALFLHRLQKRQRACLKAEEDRSHTNSQVRPAPQVAAAPLTQHPGPSAPPSTPSGLTGIAAQKAAAMSSGSTKLAGAPDFDLPLEQDIERRLRERYAPSYLDIENQGNSCGALKVAIVMVSEAFRDKPRINRQREIQTLLRPDLDSGRLHALSLMLKTPEEYAKLVAQQQERAQT
eukprot:TRINITY_DN63271_c0_g1_i1.p1 TRINITY_DN63271_c0_g1~~TRINITY_DN63271_c0_g1_i1.p1  ORF type:complete len:195 (+),score=34.68 TRINITY_DN63271_c0_g1_i1:39-623(+)